MVSPGETFVARFAAYTATSRDEVRRILKAEAPSSQQRLDLDKCRWRLGTKVVVRLAAHSGFVSQPVQWFEWDGTYKILRFDVRAFYDVSIEALILRFDIVIEGLPITTLRPKVQMIRSRQDKGQTLRSNVVEQVFPRSAFASYAGRDRREVLGRVRSVQIFTDIDGSSTACRFDLEINGNTKSATKYAGVTYFGFSGLVMLCGPNG